MSNSKSAVHHYIAQRLTAIILIPISVWFVVFIFNISRAQSPNEIFQYIKSPVNSITAIIFIIASLYHGFLGMREIITDYIHHPKLKKIIVSFLMLFTSISVITGIFSVIYMYIKLRLFPF